MRHRVYGRHLNRDKNERTALFRGLIRNLVLQESITTTEAKAKAIKGMVDRLIADSKKKTNASLNSVLSTVAQKEVSKKLVEEIAPRYASRNSGFTTLVKMGRRPGDGTMMVKMSLVEEKQAAKAEKPVKEEKKEEVKTEEKAAPKRARKAAK